MAGHKGNAALTERFRAETPRPPPPLRHSARRRTTARLWAMAGWSRLAMARRSSLMSDTFSPGALRTKSQYRIRLGMVQLVRSRLDRI